MQSADMHDRLAVRVKSRFVEPAFFAGGRRAVLPVGFGAFRRLAAGPFRRRRCAVSAVSVDGFSGLHGRFVQGLCFRRMVFGPAWL